MINYIAFIEAVVVALGSRFHFDKFSSDHIGNRDTILKTVKCRNFTHPLKTAVDRAKALAVIIEILKQEVTKMVLDTLTIKLNDDYRLSRAKKKSFRYC